VVVYRKVGGALAFNSFSFKFGPIWNCENVEELSDSGNRELDLNQAISRNLSEIRAEPENVIDINQLRKKYEDRSLGRRSAPRYAVDFEVVVITSYKSFRSKTVNISETGALLADLIPLEFTRGVFEVLFTAVDESGKRQYFLFHAKSADGPLRSKRIQFIKSKGDSAKRFNELIEQLTPVEV